MNKRRFNVSIKTLFLLLTIFSLAYLQQLKKTQKELKEEKPMNVYKDVEITGTLKVENLVANKIDSQGTMKISNDTSIDDLHAQKITIQKELIVEKIVPKNGVLTINGNVILTSLKDKKVNEDKNIENNKSFIELSSENWKLVEDKNNIIVNKCVEKWVEENKNNCDKFTNQEITKIFNNLPNHRKLRINAIYNFLGFWENDYAYLKINDVIVWKKEMKNDFKEIDFCNNKLNNPVINMEINELIEHTDNNVKITFGSTLKGDSCLHSYSIDDLMIYTK